MLRMDSGSKCTWYKFFKEQWCRVQVEVQYTAHLLLPYKHILASVWFVLLRFLKKKQKKKHSMAEDRSSPFSMFTIREKYWSNTSSLYYGEYRQAKPQCVISHQKGNVPQASYPGYCTQHWLPETVSSILDPSNSFSQKHEMFHQCKDKSASCSSEPEINLGWSYWRQISHCTNSSGLLSL